MLFCIASVLSTQGLHGKPGPRGQRGPTVCTFALQYRGFSILIAFTIAWRMILIWICYSIQQLPSLDVVQRAMV